MSDPRPPSARSPSAAALTDSPHPLSDSPRRLTESPHPTSSARERAARQLPLLAVLGLSAVMETYRLSQNGYGNDFYSAGVKSMLGSLHNFLFVSSDPGGLITIDKPPLGLWLQVLSAKLFGFSPASLLLPEAILGVLSVAALYWVMVRPFGRPAALAGALTLAIFPSFVAVSRDNNLDSLLIFLTILACGLALRACQSGRLRTLIGCACLVGLAFDTKTLAALLVAPGIALAYLLCAPGGRRQRILHLLAAGLALVLVAGVWIAVVELTPASQRPYVGGSTDDSELNLTFAYNGFGRLEGQQGAPGQITETTAAEELLRAREQHTSPREPRSPAAASHPRVYRRAPARPASSYHGRALAPTAFGGAPGPLRMLEGGLDTQGGWLLPFALCGLIAIVMLMILTRGQSRSPGGGPAGDPPAPPGDPPAPAGDPPAPPGDPRAPPGDPPAPPGDPPSSPGGGPALAGVIVLGDFFLVEWLVLSFSAGIIHPYYVSALGPGLAAMCGGGLVALGRLLAMPSRRHRAAGLGLLLVAVGSTVAAQLVILSEDQDYLHQFRIPLIVLAAAALLAAGALTASRTAARAIIPVAVILGLLLIVPGVYSASTWEVPVEGTFPAAGPHAAAGRGGVGLDSGELRQDLELSGYIRMHSSGARWGVLTEASETAAPLTLLGLSAAAMGGYSGTDPALDGPGLARLVRSREARYVLIGGTFASRGGNAASTAVLRSCKLIPASAWQPSASAQGELALFDCRGYERELEAG